MIAWKVQLDVVTSCIGDLVVRSIEFVRITEHVVVAHATEHKHIVWADWCAQEINSQRYSTLRLHGYDFPPRSLTWPHELVGV